ncbi:hypothetical protein LTR66_012704 [Elasticomyces elasticus]|nr:hypothetical protein LTR66_012704 [Elasticomyces elasticus]
MLQLTNINILWHERLGFPVDTSPRSSLIDIHSGTALLGRCATGFRSRNAEKEYGCFRTRFQRKANGEDDEGDKGVSTKESDNENNDDKDDKDDKDNGDDEDKEDGEDGKDSGNNYYGNNEEKVADEQ